jgi:uncharacterized protein YidB (DUF937 family)
VAEHVAEALPHVVDQATPGGQVPQQAGSPLDSLMGMFKK